MPWLAHNQGAEQSACTVKRNTPAMDDCDHPVQVGGLCAVCGKTVDDAGQEQGSSAQLHDISGVKVSSAEAARLDSESTRRLLSQRKLALIVDLDQTIIHATVDPTVGEWIKDGRNPNHKALADVGKFFLGVDGKAVVDFAASQQDDSRKDEEQRQEEPHGDGCWYYVKPRPGLQSFLKELSEKFEMHVYTMGTRTYAESVCKLVDPHGTIFGARIISRDENGSLVQKSLKKLFPMDTSMVVIIDDRADVWQWSPNLVRVSAFDFFVGIGDINATFLPSQSANTTVAPSTIETSSDGGETTSDSLLEMGEDDREGDDEASLQTKQSNHEKQVQREREEDDAAKSAAAESQKTAVNEQLDSRPLAKMQQALEGQTASQHSRGNDASSAKDTESTSSISSSEHEIAAVLREDDRELVRLQNILEDIHHTWYQDFESREQSHEEKPAITSIIASIKKSILANCNVVFSSVAPLDQDPASTDFWRMAVEFGAHCTHTIDEHTTHVIAAKPATEKVVKAQRIGIYAVWCSWLQDSCAHWTRLPEDHYAMPASDRFRQAKGQSLGELSSSNDRDDSTTADSHLVGDIDDEGLSDFAGDADADQGFGNMNWDEANDELDEVLAGLSDEDGDESATENESLARARDGIRDGSAPLVNANSSKRSRSSDDGRDGGADGTVLGGSRHTARPDEHDLTLSPLSKRRRMAELRAGQSKLKESMSQSESASREVSVEKHAGAVDAPTTEARQIAPSALTPASNPGGDDDDFLQSLEAELALQLDGSQTTQPPTPAPAPAAAATDEGALRSTS